MTLRRSNCFWVLFALSGCFKPADDGGDEIGATDSTGEGETTTGDGDGDPMTSSSSSSSSTTETTGEEDPFVFANDPPGAYTRVDRMGMPAIATVLVTSKDEYNAANPIDEADGTLFANEMTGQLLNIHIALDDDLQTAGLTPCVTYQCMLNQVMPLILPDTLKISLFDAPGFPNGRKLGDPVVDLTLAALMLDLQTHPLELLADLPLNPPANDVAFLPTFPYLAPPN